MSTRLVGQVGMAVAAAATFLPWISQVGASGDTLGINTGEGLLLLLTMIVGLALVQSGYKAAWIAAGLGTSVTVRRTIELSAADSQETVAFGLAIALIATLMAAVSLIVDMIKAVRSERPEELRN